MSKERLVAFGQRGLEHFQNGTQDRVDQIFQVPAENYDDVNVYSDIDNMLHSQNNIDIVHTNGNPDHKIVMLCKWFYKFNFKIVRTKHDTFPIKNKFFSKILSSFRIN